MRFQTDLGRRKKKPDDTKVTHRFKKMKKLESSNFF